MAMEKNGKIQVNDELIARAQLAQQFGSQFGGERNVYEALGYKTQLEFSDYYTRYLRQDIAKALIDRPVNRTWSGDLKISHVEDEKVLKRWKELDRKLGIQQKLKRLDKLSQLGHYAVLLLGYSDVMDQTMWARPIEGTPDLEYIKPISEQSATIAAYETNPNNPRYGLPIQYSVRIKKGSKIEESVFNVHYTRVIHVAGEILENEIEGIPYLQAVYNRLMDLEKLVGASAEMYWKGARPGYSAVQDKDYQFSPTLESGVREQIRKYEHGLSRFLFTEGVNIQALQQQVKDPNQTVDVQIQMISAVTGVPKRILTGSERGELSSSQDTDQWNNFIQDRREEFANAFIIVPFVNKLIETRQLAVDETEYMIEWPDLFAPSEKEKVEVGEKRAKILKEYAADPIVQMLIPRKQFYSMLLAFSEGKVEEILGAIEEVQIDEEEQQDFDNINEDEL
jgi:uncharacterized protein